MRAIVTGRSSWTAPIAGLLRSLERPAYRMTLYCPRGQSALRAEDMTGPSPTGNVEVAIPSPRKGHDHEAKALGRYGHLDDRSPVAGLSARCGDSGHSRPKLRRLVRGNSPAAWPQAMRTGGTRDLPNCPMAAYWLSADHRVPARSPLRPRIYDPVPVSGPRPALERCSLRVRPPSVLPDGDVLVAGGHDVNVVDYATAELYDPSTNQWTLTGSLNQARRYPIQVELANGEVLVATGSFGPPTCTRYLSSAELYDPSTGQWTYTGSTLVPRESAVAIRLKMATSCWPVDITAAVALAPTPIRSIPSSTTRRPASGHTPGTCRMAGSAESWSCCRMARCSWSTATSPAGAPSPRR